MVFGFWQRAGLALGAAGAVMAWARGAGALEILATLVAGLAIGIVAGMVAARR